MKTMGGCKGRGSDMEPKTISKIGTKCFDTGNGGSAKVECAGYTSLGIKKKRMECVVMYCSDFDDDNFLISSVRFVSVVYYLTGYSY